MGRVPLCPPDPSCCPCCTPEDSVPQQRLPGSPARSILLSLVHRGSWAYFILMFLFVSCCFSFPIVWKGAFPCLGQEGGGFPSTASLCICSLWRGFMGWCQIPASPARAWGVVQCWGSLEHWFGHRTLCHGALGLPWTPKNPWICMLCAWTNT